MGGVSKGKPLGDPLACCELGTAETQAQIRVFRARFQGSGSIVIKRCFLAFFIASTFDTVGLSITQNSLIRD